MPPTTRYSRGDVVLVPFPFTDLSSTKQRPALVVSPNRLNHLRDDVVLVAITSQVPAVLAEDEILISASNLVGTGLLKPSLVRLSKLVTIHQDLVRRKLGIISPLLLQQIHSRWQQVFAL